MPKWLRSIFIPGPKTPPSPIHDFTYRSWGHNIEEWGKGVFAVWSNPRLRDGDTIKIKELLFRVQDVETQWGVDDLVLCQLKKLPIQ